MFSKLSLQYSSDNLIAFIKFSVMLSHFHIWPGKDIQLICFCCGNSLSIETYLLEDINRKAKIDLYNKNITCTDWVTYLLETKVFLRF